MELEPSTITFHVSYIYVSDKKQNLGLKLLSIPQMRIAKNNAGIMYVIIQSKYF